MPDFTDVLARTRPAERHVPICLDGTISAQLEALEARLADAMAYDYDHNDLPTAPGVRAEIEALRAQVAEATVTFALQAMGSTAWRRLVAEHPPPEDSWQWHPIEFPLAAVAACSVDPKMTEEDAHQLAERITEGQFAKLWVAVLEINLGDEVPKFATATDGPETSAPRSTTAPPEASRTASSSASEDNPPPAISSGVNETA